VPLTLNVTNRLLQSFTGTRERAARTDLRLPRHPRPQIRRLPRRMFRRLAQSLARESLVVVTKMLTSDRRLKRLATTTVAPFQLSSDADPPSPTFLVHYPSRNLRLIAVVANDHRRHLGVPRVRVACCRLGPTVACASFVRSVLAFTSGGATRPGHPFLTRHLVTPCATTDGIATTCPTKWSLHPRRQFGSAETLSSTCLNCPFLARGTPTRTSLSI